MTEILRAFGRSLKSLTQRGVLWHLVWPTLVALALWLGVAFAFWPTTVHGLMGWIVGLPWLGVWISTSEMGTAAVLVLVQILLALLLVPLVYVTAALLVAAIGLPLMLERVAARDYADLELRRGGSNLGSVWNACKAGALLLHADREELTRIPKSQWRGTFGVGVGSALLAYIPVVNLFAPAFCGLAFAPFLLEALRRDRAGKGWAVVPPGTA